MEPDSEITKVIMNTQFLSKGLQEFNEQAKIVSKQYGGGKLYWMLNMAWCLVRYGSRPIDYVRFEYHKKSAKERNRYLTFYRYLHSIKHFGYGLDEVKDKKAEYNTYKDYIKREWIEVDKNTELSLINAFIEKHGVVIAKPVKGDMGKGVLKIKNTSSEDYHTLIREKEKKTYVVEQLIKNCNELAIINPSSLNTVRATTLIEKDGTPRILSMILRVGTPGCHVDNWGAGGIAYNFDIESGVCNMYGKDKKNHLYVFHPGSNVQMLGFKLPRYEELKKYVIELTKVYPKVRYVGWDVAITPDGFDLVEVNCPAGHDMFQSFNNPVYDIMLKNW